MPTTSLSAADLLVDGPNWAGKVYLNTAAEGLLLKDCQNAVHQYLADKSTGEPGRVPMWSMLERARERSGRLFGIPSTRVALVSSTTEALNTIAQCAYDCVRTCVYGRPRRNYRPRQAA